MQTLLRRALIGTFLTLILGVAFFQSRLGADVASREIVLPPGAPAVSQCYVDCFNNYAAAGKTQESIYAFVECRNGCASHCSEPTEVSEDQQACCELFPGSAACTGSSSSATCANVCGDTATYSCNPVTGTPPIVPAGFCLGANPPATCFGAGQVCQPTNGSAACAMTGQTCSANNNAPDCGFTCVGTPVSSSSSSSSSSVSSTTTVVNPPFSSSVASSSSIAPCASSSSSNAPIGMKPSALLGQVTPGGCVSTGLPSYYTAEYLRETGLLRFNTLAGGGFIVWNMTNYPITVTLATFDVEGADTNQTLFATSTITIPANAQGFEIYMAPPPGTNGCNRRQFDMVLGDCSAANIQTGMSVQEFNDAVNWTETGLSAYITGSNQSCNASSSAASSVASSVSSSASSVSSVASSVGVSSTAQSSSASSIVPCSSSSSSSSNSSSTSVAISSVGNSSSVQPQQLFCPSDTFCSAQPPQFNGSQYANFTGTTCPAGFTTQLALTEFQGSTFPIFCGNANGLGRCFRCVAVSSSVSSTSPASSVFSSSIQSSVSSIQSSSSSSLSCLQAYTQLFLTHFGTSAGLPGYNAAFDYNNSGSIDADDFALVQQNSGCGSSSSSSSSRSSTSSTALSSSASSVNSSSVQFSSSSQGLQCSIVQCLLANCATNQICQVVPGNGVCQTVCINPSAGSSSSTTGFNPTFTGLPTIPTFSGAYSSSGIPNFAVGQGTSVGVTSVSSSAFSITQNPGTQVTVLDPMCGDGVVQPDRGELCDRGDICTSDPNSCNRAPGTPGATCTCQPGTPNCAAPADVIWQQGCVTALCGDGVTSNPFLLNGKAVNFEGITELCDNGAENGTLNNPCTSTCQLSISPFCGNGIIDTGEQCDLGTGNSDNTPDTCRTTCSSYRCGDGVIDSGEQCDDSNLQNGDGCSSLCTSEQPAAGTNVAQVIDLPLIPAITISDGTIVTGNITDIATSHAPVGQQGPGAIAAIAAGAAAGVAWVRRRKMKVS